MNEEEAQHPVWAHMCAHHGVVSRKEALELGLSPDQVKRRRRTGEWLEMQPQVFRHAAVPPSWFGDARAAALSVGSLVSHGAAARIWHLDGFSTARLEVVVDDGKHLPRTNVEVHRSVHMALSGASIRHGVPVTGPARTILDVAGVSGTRQLRRVVDSAFRLELVTWRTLYSVLIRHSAKGRNGCGPLRQLLEDHYGDTATPDSTWNRDVGFLLTDAGLPDPRFEFEVRDAGSFIARVDLAYPRHRVAIECDSVRWHLNSDSFVADPRRRNRLLNAGWRVLTFTWDDYANRPGDLIAAVRAALDPSVRAIG